MVWKLGVGFELGFGGLLGIASLDYINSQRLALLIIKLVMVHMVMNRL